MASPKQPQSLTGLAIAIHTVMRVITVINASITRVVNRRRMAKRMKMPSANSRAANATDEPSVSQSGT